MSKNEEYGTTAESARASTRGRHLIAKPAIWVCVAIVIVGLLVMSYW
ncbi:hypothetical protein K6V92_14100 [Cupriavidus respiraculi]|nr:hypothetical protein [Cupriavidus respiraculi]MBY4947753.1 hypothetical protein [Cupriavidus respiraculi]